MAQPSGTGEVAALVRAAAAAGGTVKPVGSGHSFTGVAATSGVRVEQASLAGLGGVDRAAHRVRVRAGTRLHSLNSALATRGLALPILGDVDTQTVGGAIATGTHGTGAAFGCLSTLVEELELVTGTGEVLRCSATEHPGVFAASRVGLGALGIVTEVTLRCVDAFVLRAQELPVPLPLVLDHLDELVGSHDHVELYWMPYTQRAFVKINDRTASDSAPRGRLASWLADELLENTLLGGVCRLCRAAPALTPTLLRATAHLVSPRVYTGRSDVVFTTPRRVRFIEMEYGVPRATVWEVLRGLAAVIDELPHPVALPVEVRFTAADDIWLSHGYGRDNAYVAVHQFVGMPYEEYFRRFEAVCTALAGRPHWGKIHYRHVDSLRPAYPHFDDFVAVRNRLDPARVFANAYTTQVLGP